MFFRLVLSRQVKSTLTAKKFCIISKQVFYIIENYSSFPLRYISTSISLGNKLTHFGVYDERHLDIFSEIDMNDSSSTPRFDSTLSWAPKRQGLTILHHEHSVEASFSYA